jgi:16S rRNA (cytosine967-C5)-methyltransferase
MARLGVVIAHVLRHDWTRNQVMRRRVDLRWRLRRTDFDRMQQLQIKIVRALIPFLKLNGVLVYSTCSLEPEENEEVVRRSLTEMPVMRLETERSSLPFRDGFDGAYAARLVRNRPSG